MADARDRAPQPTNPFPFVDQGLQPQFTIQPQFTAMQPQFTSFNPYQQQAQQEAMQVYILLPHPYVDLLTRRM